MSSPTDRYKAKIAADFIAETLASGRDGRLILVTAINPTPAGEGKTTTTVGLGDALNRIGRKTAIRLREPSLGPCFGVKGGATGGGYAQVVPMDEINLHFTGDFHAITAANNLLAAMLDNHIYWGNALDIDPQRITWRRCLDMNDRALRSVSLSSGNAAAERREDGFDITVASEVMAILCLAASMEDLERRLANIIVAFTRSGEPVSARDLKADRRHGRPAQGCDQAQPGADAGEQSGVRPRRSLRQHRPRLQFGPVHAPGAEAGGLCGHRSGFRGRPGAPRSSSTSSVARRASGPMRW